jgi:acyl-coenzyme A thioesterase PaaI-like protein
MGKGIVSPYDLLSLNIVRALTPKVPRVRAEGKVLHCGRQLATADGKLYGPDGKLYAHGTTTCFIMEQ